MEPLIVIVAVAIRRAITEGRWYECMQNFPRVRTLTEVIISTVASVVGMSALVDRLGLYSVTYE